MPLLGPGLIKNWGSWEECRREGEREFPWQNTWSLQIILKNVCRMVEYEAIQAFKVWCFGGLAHGSQAQAHRSLPCAVHAP